MSNSNYPKAWSRFISRNKEADNKLPENLSSNFAQLSRWSARFRLAKSFKGLDLGDHYSGSDTPQLYSAITRIFLVYSAFETYCKTVGLNPSRECQVKELQDALSQQVVIQTIRQLDPNNAFPRFLEEHLCSTELKKMMCKFIDGEDVNVSFLARCIRHVFAHGVLTANSFGLSAKSFD